MVSGARVGVRRALTPFLAFSPITPLPAAMTSIGIRDVEDRLTDWPAMTSGDFHKGPEREAGQARDGMWLGKGVRWTVSGRPRAEWLDGQMDGWTENGYVEVLRLLHHRRNHGPWWWCSKVVAR